MASLSDLFLFRDGVAQDRNYILSTWSKTARANNSYLRRIEGKAYEKYIQRHMERLLGAPSTEVRVATLKPDEAGEDPPIVGYSVYTRGEFIDSKRIVSRETILHFVYVREPWRRLGLGKSLVPQPVAGVTCFTGYTLYVAPDLVWFNPFWGEKSDE